MKNQYPKYVAILYLSLLFIPFILIQSFYPFFRFGMFAEPLQKSSLLQSQESLKVYYQSKDGDWAMFKPELLGFGQGHYEYIIRNEFYSKQGKELLEKTQQVFAQQYATPQKWILVQKHHESDSMVVAEYQLK